jgi:tRNA pseudouridine32 synthase / 23S rRNA pseudouridine746 synthase
MPPPDSRPLPTRDGVGPSCVGLPPAGPWTTMVQFLQERFAAIAPQEWARRMAAGEVLDEHGVAVTAQRPYQGGMRLYYYRSLPAEPRIAADEVVLHHDAHLLVVDKPHFLPVTPGGRWLQETLLVRLRRRLGLDELAPIHRLDRETAGLVLFSVQAATRGAYHALFSQREVTKQYDAVVHWRPGLSLPLTHCSRLEGDANFMQMREVPGEPNSQTQVELKHVQGPHALLGLTPHTGKRHQLRVHCAALGMPILHDLIYPQLQPPHSDDAAHPLQLLARALEFRDPLSGRMRRFDSGLSLSLHSP